MNSLGGHIALFVVAVVVGVATFAAASQPELRGNERAVAAVVAVGVAAAVWVTGQALVSIRRIARQINGHETPLSERVDWLAADTARTADRLNDMTDDMRRVSIEVAEHGHAAADRHDRFTQSLRKQNNEGETPS